MLPELMIASGTTMAMWAAFITLALRFETRLIFGMPKVIRRAPLGPFKDHHDTLEVAIERAGHTLVGWVTRPRTRASRQQAKIAVYFGGRNEDVRWTPDIASWLGPEWTVCAFAYRGRTGSTGEPSQDACVQDAARQVRWIMRQHRKRSTQSGSSARLVLIGRSLGATIAVLVAQAIKDELEVSNLVLLSPPLSIAALVRRNPLLAPATPLLKTRLEAYKAAQEVDADALVLMAETDTRVPHEHSAALAAMLAGQTTVEVMSATTHRSLPRSATTLSRLRSYLDTGLRS